MASYTGITSTSYERFVVDAGQIRSGFTSVASPGTLLGATRGGSTFTIETEYRDMPVDGAKGPVQGGRRITKVSVKLSATFIEWTTDLIKMVMPGSSEVLSTDHDVVTRTLHLTNSDYITNVAILGEVSDPLAGPVIFVISKALCTANFEAALTDSEEATLKAEFEGHFLPTDLDTEPWAIWWPHDSDSTTTAGA